MRYPTMHFTQRPKHTCSQLRTGVLQIQEVLVNLVVGTATCGCNKGGGGGAPKECLVKIQSGTVLSHLLVHFSCPWGVLCLQKSIRLKTRAKGCYIPINKQPKGGSVSGRSRAPSVTRYLG